MRHIEIPIANLVIDEKLRKHIDDDFLKLNKQRRAKAEAKFKPQRRGVKKTLTCNRCRITLPREKLLTCNKLYICAKCDETRKIKRKFKEELKLALMKINEADNGENMSSM